MTSSRHVEVVRDLVYGRTYRCSVGVTKMVGSGMTDLVDGVLMDRVVTHCCHPIENQAVPITGTIRDGARNE